MPRTGPKVLYQVWLKRKGAKNLTVHTLAASPEQAIRFAEWRNKGYSARKIAIA